MDDVKKILRAVPGSYDDFVNDTFAWMKRDEDFHDAIIKQLNEKPDSDTDELTLILWKHLGIGEPVELVEDEIDDVEENGHSHKGFRGVAMF